MITFEEANAYIWKRIKSNTYPEGHPFNDRMFVKNEFIVCILSLLRMYLLETDMVDDYIDNKLKALDKGGYNTESYFQGLNEIVFFYYLFTGVIKSNMLNQVLEIRYENFSITNPAKKLEYTLLFSSGVTVCTEIKTITCDPFIKEKTMAIDKGIYIKKYFHNCDLSEMKNIVNFKILESSTHDRQLRKNIKLISQKYEGKNTTPLQTINLGVIFIQFATSIEEFYAYMLNQDDGIIYQQDLGNIDCLIFFSLTARPELDMEDVYKHEHTFSILLNDKPYVMEYLKVLRLDNYIAKKINGNIQIRKDIVEFTRERYGVFKQVVRDGIILFVPIEKNEDEINTYIDYVNEGK